jgi:hypothetical protein
MGPGIIIPLVIVIIVVPLALSWARKTFRSGSPTAVEAPPPSARLTSNALRTLPTPPWRIVPEIAPDKLGGIEHVLIGAAGVFGVETSMDPLPAPVSEPTPQQVAEVAIRRGALDDALRRCAMESDRIVTVHWGLGGVPQASVAVLPGLTAVDGRALGDWAASLAGVLTPAQVDLAWQTVLTAIGRPDPLA